MALNYAINERSNNEGLDVVEHIKRIYDRPAIKTSGKERLNVFDRVIHDCIFCSFMNDMDNYYLNNAVYLMEEFLESTQEPYYNGEVDYGDRAEHCWNGDQENPNYISRLRYNSMYVPKIVKRIEESAPEGADLSSWRY